MRSVTAAALDLCCVLAFVIIGRAGHSEGETAAGIAGTAWPFLAALAIGWVMTRAWRRPLAFAPTAVGVWSLTVAAGMVLRVVAGQGTAVTFVLVSLVFLGLVMFGWRGAARLFRAAAQGIRRPGRRRGPASSSPRGRSRGRSSWPPTRTRRSPP